MFTRRFSLALGVMLAAMLLGAMPASAGTRTPFELTWIEVVPGYPTSGQITMPGNNYHEQGWVNKIIFTSTDPRMVGEITIVAKSLIKLDTPTPGWGPTMGTWTVDVNSDGIAEWEGNVKVNPQTAPWPGIASYTGHGLGIYHGLQINFDHNFGDGTVLGEIRDPHGK